MKLICSRGSQLSKALEEIESLRKENHELRQDNCTLRAQLARGTGRTLPKPVAHNSTPRRTNGLSSYNGTTPSYLQPTRASRLRAVTSTSSNTATTPKKSGSSSPSPKPRTSTSPGHNGPWNPKVPVAGTVKVNEKDVLYENGKLKVMGFRFLMGTHSHSNRVAARRKEFPRSCFFRSSNATWGWEPPATKTPDEKHQPATKFQIMPQATFDALISRQAYEKRTQRVIARRTQLSANPWITTYSSPVCINHDRLYKILTEALAVAKGCVFRWFRTHRPQYFKYLSDIDFGRDRITPKFYCMPYTIHHKLESLIQLRNHVCHFGGDGSVSSGDYYVKDVHEFAVLLLDEEGARAARGLRDQLRAEAEKILEEIMTLTMLTACAGNGDEDGVFWCVHHSDTVRGAVSRLDRNDSLEHRGLDIAAREWACHHRGLNYGRGAPEVEGCTETTGRSAHAVGMLDTTSSEQQTGNIRQWEKMQWPRGSFSVEARCPDKVLEGMGNQENGESAAGFYVLV